MSTLIKKYEQFKLILEDGDGGASGGDSSGVSGDVGASANGDTTSVNLATGDDVSPATMDIQTGGVAYANQCNTSGMGDIISAQPGKIPGTTGTVGSGDFGLPLGFLPKFSKKHKKHKAEKNITNSPTPKVMDYDAFIKASNDFIKR